MTRMTRRGLLCSCVAAGPFSIAGCASITKRAREQNPSHNVTHWEDMVLYNHTDIRTISLHISCYPKDLDEKWVVFDEDLDFTKGQVKKILQDKIPDFGTLVQFNIITTVGSNRSEWEGKLGPSTNVEISIKGKDDIDYRILVE